MAAALTVAALAAGCAPSAAVDHCGGGLDALAEAGFHTERLRSLTRPAEEGQLRASPLYADRSAIAVAVCGPALGTFDAASATLAAGDLPPAEPIGLAENTTEPGTFWLFFAGDATDPAASYTLELSGPGAALRFSTSRAYEVPAGDCPAVLPDGPADVSTAGCGLAVATRWQVADAGLDCESRLESPLIAVRAIDSDELFGSHARWRSGDGGCVVDLWLLSGATRTVAIDAAVGFAGGREMDLGFLDGRAVASAENG